MISCSELTLFGKKKNLETSSGFTTSVCTSTQELRSMSSLSQKISILCCTKDVIFDSISDNLEDYFTSYFGMNATGRTNSFQTAMTPRDRVKVSSQNCLVHVDFFEL